MRIYTTQGNPDLHINSPGVEAGDAQYSCLMTSGRSYIQIERCFQYGSRGNGLSFTGTVDATSNQRKAVSCIFRDNGGKGVNSSAEDSDSLSNCVIYGNLDDGLGLQHDAGDTFVVKNCIISSANNGAYYTIDWDGNGTFTHTNNVICDLAAAAHDANNVVLDATDIAANPLFLNVTANDFRIRESSPCRDAGANLSLTSDIRGRAVPLNGTPDIGAYEGRGRAILLPGDLFLGYQP